MKLTLHNKTIELTDEEVEQVKKQLEKLEINIKDIEDLYRGGAESRSHQKLQKRTRNYKG
jgi:hypothetical protein